MAGQVTPESIRWLDAVGSTQDAAHGLAAAGGPHGSAIAARVQTAGRGTRRRQWVSSEGGLWLSVVCRPREIIGIETVSIRVGLSLAALVERWIGPGPRVAIKWTNDLIVNDRKVGGVLAEARWQGGLLAWLVVGVGINVHNVVPAHTAPLATRLAQFGVTSSIEALAPSVVAVVREAARTAAALTPQELRAFEARDWLRGRRLTLPHAGIAQGITEEGKLRIRTADAEVVEAMGSVELAGETL
jgi:BirA family transcriptional regulator, biotin operon repressor / biotin---[acetyl-CoA-carboxylase] ligase